MTFARQLLRAFVSPAVIGLLAGAIPALSIQLYRASHYVNYLEIYPNRFVGDPLLYGGIGFVVGLAVEHVWRSYAQRNDRQG